MDLLYKRLENMPFKMPHLTEEFEQGIYDVEHPEIRQNTMWYLSKAIGR